MTRILFSGDHHFDESKRFDECIRVHDWMVEQARLDSVDAFVSCGDIYERASTPAEREAVSQWLIAMAAVCPVFVVKGNHDRHLDCAIMAKLKSEHPIVVEEAAGVHRVGNVALALIAWPERARILQWAAQENLAPSRASDEAMRDLLRGLGVQARAMGGPIVAAGHLMINGAVTSVGQPLLGQPINVSLQDLLLLGAQTVVAGHVHKPQNWRLGDMGVCYTGSPYRTSYGETEEKSVLVLDVTAEQQWTRVPTPCAGMILISEQWDGQDALEGTLDAWLYPDEAAGADVRLRYEVPADQREQASAVAREWEAQLYALGARAVQVEEIVASTVRARAPEVAKALTLADKLRALWQARDDVPEPARQTRLIDKAQELEP